MESWVSDRLKTFLPALEGLAINDEEQIAALCEAEIQALRDRKLGSIYSYKRPLRELRNAVKALPLSDENSYINPHDGREHLALKYLSLSEEEKIAINQPSEKTLEKRLTHQAFIHHPEEVVARIEQLLQSHRWEELTAGLSCCTGRRLVEVTKFAIFREKSAYSVWFAGQRKTDHPDEYEIPTLVRASLVIAAWQRLRALRDFSETASDSISSSFGPAVKAVVNREFGELIEAASGRAELYTHMLRAVYPRLAIYYFLPRRVQALAYANAILGHTLNRDGEMAPNYQGTLYYMTYKILNEDGSVDGREGIKLSDPEVEPLDQFKETQAMTTETETTTKEKATKIGVKTSTKSLFDEEQKVMECHTAEEAVLKLIQDHWIYRQLEQVVNDVPTLVTILQDAVDIRLEHETLLEALQAAISDKRRFRSTYDKRREANAEKDYSSMPLEELVKTRTPEASLEKWKRAVDMIMAYNNRVDMPELRFYINAAAVKALLGGRGSEIGRYLKEYRQVDLNGHHGQYRLRPSINYGRDNIRERVFGLLGINWNTAPEEENDDE